MGAAVAAIVYRRQHDVIDAFLTRRALSPDAVLRSVEARTRQIGTRIALDATQARILWLVRPEGAVIAAAGAGIGGGRSGEDLGGAVTEV